MKRIPDIDLNANSILLRRNFGEDANSPIDIFSILSNRDDLTLVFYPLGERISGICVNNEDNKLIAINSAFTYGRQRFTAAHELCHLFFHENLNRIICPENFNKNIDSYEIEADKFASYFLAPYESLRDFIKTRIKNGNKELSLNDVIKIEQYYGLSRRATLWRLISDGYLSQEASEKMKENIIISATKLGYSDQLYKQSEKGKQYYTLGKYIKLAENLKEAELISHGKYEELLLNAFREDLVYGIEPEGKENYD